jgi:hypothetical protein
VVVLGAFSCDITDRRGVAGILPVLVGVSDRGAHGRGCGMRARGRRVVGGCFSSDVDAADFPPPAPAPSPQELEPEEQASEEWGFLLSPAHVQKHSLQ